MHETKCLNWLKNDKREIKNIWSSIVYVDEKQQNSMYSQSAKCEREGAREFINILRMNNFFDNRHSKR